MWDEKKLRLIRVAKEFKIGLNTVADFLQNKGIKIDGTPDTPVDKATYAILEEEFGANRSIKSTHNSVRERISEKKILENNNTMELFNSGLTKCLPAIIMSVDAKVVKLKFLDGRHMQLNRALFALHEQERKIRQNYIVMFASGHIAENEPKIIGIQSLIDWQISNLKDAQQTGKVIRAKVMYKPENKQYYIVNVFGVKALLYKNQIANQRKLHQDEIVPIIVTEYKGEQIPEFVLVSNSEAVRREEFNNLKNGSEITAVISKIEPTFALAEFGSLHGIIHKSELFAGNTRDMGVYFSIGEEIQAKVLSKESEDGKLKIRLGIPETLGDEAWHNVESRYQLNNIYQGTVIAVADEGVYVKLEKYIEARIPARELKWERTGGDSDLYIIGHKLNILLTRIDVCGKMMEASVRMLTPDPWQVAASELKHGQIIPVRITGEKGKYLVVETDDNLKLCGRISLSEISWVYKYNELPENIKPKQGCVVEAKIVILQPEKRKMELSIRQTEPNPWADISVGAQVWGDIGPSNEDGTTTVYLECGLSASTKDINLTTNMGEHIPFKVIECNKIGQQIFVSHNRWVHDKETDRIIRNFFNPQTLL